MDNSAGRSVCECVPVVCRLSPASLDDLVKIEENSNQAPWSRKFFSCEFQNTFSRIYGARVSGQLAGFTVVHVVVDEAHIVNLAVAPWLRRRGIGRAMLKEVLDELFFEDINWVYLEVRAGNDQALSLYRSLGFVQAGVRRKYYSDNNEDAVLMTLDLQEFAGRRAAPLGQAAGY